MNPAGGGGGWVEGLVYDLHCSGSLALKKRKPCSRSVQKLEKSNQ